jgi:cell division control protein 6
MRQDLQKNSTEYLIESIHQLKQKRSIILNRTYLDDENLPDYERTEVLNQVFNQNIREKQIRRIIDHLSPILDGVQPQSALIYGPTGSGKTVSLMRVLSSFSNIAKQRQVRFRYAYIDLTTPKTSFGAFNEVAMALDESIKRYRKGMPTEYMQARIVETLQDFQGFLCLLIDEIDNIKPLPDDFLTFLAKTLPRKTPARLILIMLTNRLNWERNLDPRILSVLKKVDIIFEPYDALDLLEILKIRVNKALEANKVENSAIRKVAAYASRETGDARKAVSLLAKAAQVAEEESGRLTIKEVDVAEERIEVDKSEEFIGSLALHQKMALLACYSFLSQAKSKISTGEAYQAYQIICGKDQTRPLTQRRFSDLISFLDLYGLVNARMVSKGRYGNTREISGSLPQKVVERLLPRWPQKMKSQ